MLATLPSAAGVSTASYADGQLPVLAVLVHATATGDQVSAVTARTITHPRFAALLDRAGACAVNGGWRIPTKALPAVLDALHPRWRPTMPAPAGSTRATATATKTSPCGVRVTVTTTKGKWSRLLMPPVPAAGVESQEATQSSARGPLRLLLGQLGEPVTMAALDAHELVEACRAAGLPVLRAGNRERLSRLDDSVSRSVVARAVPGMPAVVNVAPGPAVTLPANLTGQVAAHDLARAKLPATARLAHDAATADALAIAAATAQQRTGLHPWQDLFVSRYASTSRGMVNALAPGLGKSAAALAGVREHALRSLSWYGVVVAPTTSRSQWLAEAARWFPEAVVLDAGTGATLTQALRQAPHHQRVKQEPAEPTSGQPERRAGTGDSQRYLLVLTTADLLARHHKNRSTRIGDGTNDETSDVPNAGAGELGAAVSGASRGAFDQRTAERGTGEARPSDGPFPYVDDLIVDEGTFLAAESVRSRALWALRGTSARAMVLTGTPTPRRMGNLEPLMGFALGDRDLFALMPLSQYHDIDPLARLGAYLHTHTEPVASARAEHEVRLHEPDQTVRVIDQVVRRRLTQLLDSPSIATKLENELAAARLAYTDPAALLASKYALAGDVATAMRGAGIDPTGHAASTKVGAVTDLVCELVATGEQVLVFADFLRPLDALGRNLTASGMARQSVAAVTSKVTPAARQLALDGLRDGTVKVLMLSGTAHLGLNLQTATSVVHLDVPTSHAKLTQRAARAARLGATGSSVPSVCAVAAGTVEDRLADLVGARGLRAANQEDLRVWVRRLLDAPLHIALAG